MSVEGSAAAMRLRARARPTWSAVVGWVTYDMASTIFSLAVLSVYFPIWIATFRGAEDSDFGFTISASMTVVFLLSPLLGALTDQAPRRMPFLVASTLLCVGCTLLIGQSSSLGLTLLCVAIANVGYQVSLMFYDALLPAVSTEENRGQISGIGTGVGFIGSLIAIGVGLSIISDAAQVSAAQQSAQYITTFQVVALLYLVLALPCFLLIREQRRENRFSVHAVGTAIQQIAATWRSGKRYPGLLRFLVGRLVYNDAISTVVLFMGVYVVNEMGFSQTDTQMVLLVAVLGAVAGGFLWSQVVDRLGPRRTLQVVLFVWMVVFASTAALGYLPLPGELFWGVAALSGIAMGGTTTTDRPLLLRLTPPERVGEFFGLYAMVGRFSAITGPLIWGLLVDTWGFGRPFAVLTLLAGIIISSLIIAPISDAPRHWEEPEQ